MRKKDTMLGLGYINRSQFFIISRLSALQQPDCITKYLLLNLNDERLFVSLSRSFSRFRVQQKVIYPDFRLAVCFVLFCKLFEQGISTGQLRSFEVI